MMRLRGILTSACMAAICFAGTMVQAEINWTNGRYLCDRDVEVPFTRVLDDAGGLMVLTVEGSQVTLLEEPAASGQRYGWPSDGAHYIWHEKGEAAMLLWSEAKQETVVYQECRLQQ